MILHGFIILSRYNYLGEWNLFRLIASFHLCQSPIFLKKLQNTFLSLLLQLKRILIKFRAEKDSLLFEITLINVGLYDKFMVLLKIFNLFYVLKMLFTYFLTEGKGGRKREKHQCVVASRVPPTRDQDHNPGMCPTLGTLWFADWHSIH